MHSFEKYRYPSTSEKNTIQPDTNDRPAGFVGSVVAPDESPIVPHVLDIALPDVKEYIPFRHTWWWIWKKFVV